MLMVIFLLSYLPRSMKQGKLTESAENHFKCKIFSETSSSFDRSWKWRRFQFCPTLHSPGRRQRRTYGMEKREKINRYVHRTIQNEMMQIMVLRVLQEVAENIQNVDFSSIMCDEATDIKNVSELAVGWTTNWKLMTSSSV